MNINLSGNGYELPQKNKTLILVSGGVESTSLTKYLLSNTDYPITAVFLYVPNMWGKAECEREALSILIPKLQQIRPFTYTEVKIEMPWQVQDAYWQIGFIPMLLKATNAEYMYRGLCADDYADGQVCYYHRIAHNAGAWINKTEEELAPDFPHLHLTKKQHMEYLGELRDLTFSCQLPINNKPCGKCRSCLMRNKE